MKDNASIPQKKLRPTEAYPNLAKHMAKVAKTSKELYDLTKPEVLGEVLNIKKQSMQHLVDKEKEKNGK